MRWPMRAERARRASATLLDEWPANAPRDLDPMLFAVCYWIEANGPRAVSDVARDLEVDRERVSRIVRRARLRGYLRPPGGDGMCWLGQRWIEMRKKRTP